MKNFPKYATKECVEALKTYNKEALKINFKKSFPVELSEI